MTKKLEELFELPEDNTRGLTISVPENAEDGRDRQGSNPRCHSERGWGAVTAISGRKDAQVLRD